ncbi:LacI family DNA-binding transcriptional regulator [Swingsia samuiensis]|uniref:LacI family DNA-binding transcriptional regulator n=1 Tax=Swingsia samuiensis TaxID=1293412 RepID=A0A4Y6UJR2_9PROT|nr:LacI family DNA-binding transcriptional regulator [Swingsia samuiensis]QDH16607.1 LacI family DNA-binding transcriptional regulator [Swingsia samuiensis]
MNKPRQYNRRKVTLKDVAAYIGVSHTTISNAYIRPNQLSVELRKKILLAAQELGYTGPDPAAKQLATGRSGVIGFLFSEDLPYAFSDPALRAVLQGVALSCNTLKTDLTLISASNNLQNIDHPVSLGNAAVDGYILYSVAPDNRCILMAQQRNVPLVVIDQPRLSNIPYIGIDDRKAAYQAAQYLLGLGHRKFGIISLKTAHDNYNGVLTKQRRHNITHSTIAMRLEGYLAACTEAGLSAEAIPIWETAINSKEQGKEGALFLNNSSSPPTAILAMSDCLALGAMEHFRSAGFSIPQDLSIFGFDDIPEAHSAGLTTVHQPHEQKGIAAVQLLTQQTTRDNISLPTRLVIRNSTGPAPHKK